MASPKIEERLVIAEGKIDKLEQMLLDNIDLINYLHQKYSKFIPKNNGIELGTINGIKTQRYVEQYNRKLNGK